MQAETRTIAERIRVMVEVTVSSGAARNGVEAEKSQPRDGEWIRRAQDARAERYGGA